MQFDKPTLVPRYDESGFDSGLWTLYVDDFVVYDNLTLYMRGGQAGRRPVRLG